MRLDFSFVMIAALHLLAGCGSAEEGATAAAASGAGGGGGAGAGGGGGGIAIQSGDTAAASGSSGSSDCTAAHECGTFGHGCVNCAITSMCAMPYKACWDDPSCIEYAACFNSCGPKDSSCVKKCSEKAPQAATEYSEVIKCVICGACRAACSPTPEECQ